MQSSDTNPVIEVIIVNYNAGDALTRCVRSVLSQKFPVQITLVDNCSTDDSIARLQNTIGPNEDLAFVNNDENPGFAKGVNQAARESKKTAPYLLILNPDCEMFPGSLAALAAALDDDAGAVLAGPLVVDQEGLPMRGTLRRFPNPLSSLLTFSGLWRLGRWVPALNGVEQSGQLPACTTRAEAVSGACMLVRRSEFFTAGCMDEAYGLHCEDLDLMYRLRQRGFHCLFVPLARVFHQQGVSSSGRPVWVHWQKHRGMQRFFLKFQGKNMVFPAKWLVITGIWLRFGLTLPLVWFSD